MFKRIFAFLIMIFFICFKCLTWVPSAAATGIPAFDAFYYAILQTLGMAYTNGVEMDLAPAIAEVREAVPDYLQQPDVALKYLLRVYAGKAWDYIAYNWENSSIIEDVTSAETAAIGLANASGVSIPTLQDIVTQWGGKALDNDRDITTPINTNTIAFWNKFNKLWINQYLERVNYVEDNTPVPSPDPDYISYLTRTNSLTSNGFWWKNLSVGGTAIITNWTFNYFAHEHSFYSYGPMTSDWDAGTQLSMTPYIVNININSNDGIYSFNTGNLSFVSDAVTINGSPRDAFSLSAQNNLKSNIDMNPSNNGIMLGSNRTAQSLSFSFTGTLDGCLDMISKYLRNVNIYVDGVLWATGGVINPAVSNFQSSVPNAVIDTGTDDGEIVANPIYWVVDNNTGTPIDSQINLDKLIDYLKGIIDGTNDDTSVDFGDIVDAGVIEKQDGTAITDADVITVPVADVIDDAMARADPISIPFVITGTLPPLPPLPPFFPTPDFPEGDPTSGFNGMSVLARIINITNQSMPSDVIIVFYGVVFGAVVLGLIKILHK